MTVIDKVLLPFRVIYVFIYILCVFFWAWITNTPMDDV